MCVLRMHTTVSWSWNIIQHFSHHWIQSHAASLSFAGPGRQTHPPAPCTCPLYPRSTPRSRWRGSGLTSTPACTCWSPPDRGKPDWLTSVERIPGKHKHKSFVNFMKWCSSSWCYKSYNESHISFYLQNPECTVPNQISKGSSRWVAASRAELGFGSSIWKRKQ